MLGSPHGHNHGNSLTADAVASPEVFPSANPNPACPQLLPTHPGSAQSRSQPRCPQVPTGVPILSTPLPLPSSITLIIGSPAPPQSPTSQRGTLPPRHIPSHPGISPLLSPLLTHHQQGRGGSALSGARERHCGGSGEVTAVPPVMLRWEAAPGGTACAPGPPLPTAATSGVGTHGPASRSALISPAADTGSKTNTQLKSLLDLIKY